MSFHLAEKWWANNHLVKFELRLGITIDFIQLSTSKSVRAARLCRGPSATPMLSPQLKTPKILPKRAPPRHLSVTHLSNSSSALRDRPLGVRDRPIGVIADKGVHTKRMYFSNIHTTSKN